MNMHSSKMIKIIISKFLIVLKFLLIILFLRCHWKKWKYLYLIKYCKRWSVILIMIEYHIKFIGSEAVSRALDALHLLHLIKSFETSLLIFLQLLTFSLENFWNIRLNLFKLRYDFLQTFNLRNSNIIVIY